MIDGDDTQIEGERPDQKGGELTVHRITAEASDVQRREAVSLLLTGRADAEGKAVDSFFSYIGDKHIDISNLWQSSLGGRPCAAALIIEAAGRTGMAFVSPLAERQRVLALTAAIRSAGAALDPAKVQVIQTLLDPGQELEAQALMSAEFKKLAHLVYMQRPVATPSAVPAGNGGGGAPAGRALRVRPPMRVVPWSTENHRAFADAILASYEQTLDCPGLLGMRQIDDIIAGHQATGRFVPALWMALYEEDVPVAVMLLNALPQRQALELVYLGVSVPFRGQSWARRLLEHAIHLAAQRRCNKIMLAVDEHNTPALKLYRTLGFAATSRRTALIRAVRADERGG